MQSGLKDWFIGDIWRIDGQAVERLYVSTGKVAKFRLVATGQILNVKSIDELVEKIKAPVC